jgi:hypothetical protein
VLEVVEEPGDGGGVEICPVEAVRPRRCGRILLVSRTQATSRRALARIIQAATCAERPKDAKTPSW